MGNVYTREGEILLICLKTIYNMIDKMVRNEKDSIGYDYLRFAVTETELIPKLLEMSVKINPYRRDGLDPDNIHEAIEYLAYKGYIEVTDNKIRLTGRGVDRIEQRFTNYPLYSF
jgi:hypothetical protein